jgi:16S rRNA (uracil1498-N3)-methyltransferase
MNSVTPKEQLELFDASGNRAIVSVKSIDSTSSVLTLLSHVKVNEGGTTITLAVGMPKGERSDWLVEKATETGIGALIPLSVERGILKVKDPKMERWQRLMVQASKQSLTRTPPVLRERMDMNELINEEISNYDMVIWGCMPEDTQYKPKRMHCLQFPKKPANVLLVIGPEGDMTNSEKKQLEKAGAQAVVLSPNRLRTETAAIVMTSLASLLFASSDSL